MRLNKKTAIITGSASGFGEGIAKKFSDEGANLIMVDINSKLLKKVSKIYHKIILLLMYRKLQTLMHY